MSVVLLGISWLSLPFIYLFWARRHLHKVLFPVEGPLNGSPMGDWLRLRFLEFLEVSPALIIGLVGFSLIDANSDFISSAASSQSTLNGTFFTLLLVAAFLVVPAETMRLMGTRSVLFRVERSIPMIAKAYLLPVWIYGALTGLTYGAHFLVRSGADRDALVDYALLAGLIAAAYTAAFLGIGLIGKWFGAIGLLARIDRWFDSLNAAWVQSCTIVVGVILIVAVIVLGLTL